jgi:hypothetical protein
MGENNDALLLSFLAAAMMSRFFLSIDRLGEWLGLGSDRVVVRSRPIITHSFMCLALGSE